MGIVSPHDKYFKVMMSDPRVSKDFLQFHLPENIKLHMGFDSLHLEKESYLDEELDLNRTDLVFSCDFKGRKGFIYILVEHQSTVDPIMPFRLLKYKIRIMDDHMNKTESNILPIVYPLVFYHGQALYNHTKDLFELFAEPDLAREILFQPFELIDVGRIPDAKLREHVWSGVMELTLKHIFARDIIPFAKDIMRELKRFERWDAIDLAKVTIFYLMNTVEDKQKKQVINLIKTELSKSGEEIMTFREYCIAEGRAEGWAEGRAEGMEKGVEKGRVEVAKNALRQGFSTEAIKQLTGLSISVIEKLDKAEIS